MKEKTAVTVIGGADGPTSVFLAGKISGKKALKERFRQSIYRYNRKKAAKKISANPHTLRQVIAYANKKYHAQEMPTTHRRYQEEFMFLGLRMNEGIEKSRFYQKFGFTVDFIYKDAIEKLISEGMLQETTSRLYLTETGMDLNNYAAAHFLF